MDEKSKINSMVRRKLKELRLRKGLKLREIAARAGIPLSSYACMEAGHYNLSLDHLFRILGVLEVDIAEVWPVETAAVDSISDQLYLHRIQSFRLGEVITLSGAEGGALFTIRDGQSDVVMHQSLSDFLLDRLLIYLEDGRDYSHGIWFQREHRDTHFLFFLKTSHCPDFVTSIVRRYMVIWSHVFGS